MDRVCCILSIDAFPWNGAERAVGIRCFTVKVYRYYAWLRENLRPYIVSVAAEAHKLGIPMMRPLAMIYPEDQEATKVWDEYLFGENLLVAPVSDETEEREIYFPKGRWISLWNLNDEISGPVQRSVEVPIDKIPVYVREGSFLPLRLNENLKLGESMSESETEMILAVVPQNDSIVKETLYERSGAKTCCDMKKMAKLYSSKFQEEQQSFM